jgi:hypothetical protein
MVAIVLRRDHWACVCCGTLVAGRPYSVRYRSPDGGDSPANLLTFLGDGRHPHDPSDHRARVDSGRDPCDAARGYVVPAGQDPALVPVAIASRCGGLAMVWLGDGESYLTAAPEGATA